jgi:SAM-dependent methyltransferase
MSKGIAEKPDYSNWVSTKFISIPGVVTVLFLILAFVFPVLLIIALILLIIAAYFAYARYSFSEAGGDIQTKIQDILLTHLDWNGQGKVLDIGCGNAPLTIRLAHTYPEAQITGIDYWGDMWEYSKSVCERNAMIEGVALRTSFQKASASDLPFDDETFDAVVSNLVFHEVRDTKDKMEVIREALRVTKRGGRFAFQDLFLWKAIYGDTNKLVATIKSWGIASVEFIPTNDAPFIPKALKLPFMVGTIGILRGEKSRV